LPKNIFDRAPVFSAVRNSMCKCRCGWEKLVGKIRHEDFYLEDAAERKTSVAYLTSCERCRRLEQDRARRRWRSERAVEARA